jgi:hypothetical protein
MFVLRAASSLIHSQAQESLDLLSDMFIVSGEVNIQTLAGAGSLLPAENHEGDDLTTIPFNLIITH